MKAKTKSEKVKDKLCTVCKRRRAYSNFVRGNDKDGYCIVCTDCRKKIAKDVEGLRKYCELSNRNFSTQLWNLCMELAEQQLHDKLEGLNIKQSSKKIEERAINLYFSKMNMSGLAVDDEVDFNSIEDSQSLDYIDNSLLKFWGRFKDYTKEDYEFLQENYESWLMECKSDTLAEKKLYKQICLQELEIQKLREAGKSVVKETESLQKLMDSANVKPKDINAANDPSNASVLGMIIKDIEQYRPAEYFEDKKMYYDFDGIKDYLTRFVFRPLKNLLLGTRDFDKEFNIDKDSSDLDE